MWSFYDSCKTIGTIGSEEGVIVRDETHSEGARLTLESDGAVAPFSITSGVYGQFFHTTFISERDEAESKFECMKEEIHTYLSGDEGIEWVEKFVERY